jgi:hypothetical protein
MKFCSSTTASIAARISARIVSCCAFRSSMGTFTSSPSPGPPPSDQRTPVPLFS